MKQGVGITVTDYSYSSSQYCSQTYDDANQLLSSCSLVVEFQLGLILLVPLSEFTT